ncbi:MAG: alpha/beta hydrolase-fold protein [Bacteroidota bacterium]
MIEIRTTIEQYIQSAHEDTALQKQLIAQCNALSAEQLEVIVRQGPPRNTEGQTQKGRLYGDLPLRCRQVNYETEYFLYVPTRYAPSQATPLLLVGHGGNGNMAHQQARLAAYGGLEAWLAIAEEKGWILAAPLTQRGWGVMGYAVLFSLLSKLQRQFYIDPDRIYLTGHSMGGHLSWRSAMHVADRFAAISPMSGGYDYVAKGMMSLLNLVPGYATFGEREPYGIAEVNRTMIAWLKEHPEIDWQIVEKRGGHEIFKDELPKIADFMEARPRDLYRSALAALGLAKDRWDQPNKPWDRKYRWDKQQAIWRSYFHWIQLFDEPQLQGGAFQELAAQIDRTENAVRLQVQNVNRLRVYLHPKILDISSEIKLYINDQLYWQGVPTRRTALLLQNLRRLDDWGRVYPTALDIDLRRMI